MLRKLLRKTPTLWNIAFRQLTSKRVAHARAFMERMYLYPHEREAILADYGYSISRTFRGLPQVLDIEEAVRSVAADGVDGAFVECGTYTGGASAFALRSILRNEKDRVTRQYWGFDSFEGMPRPTAADGDYALRWMSSVASRSAVGALASGELVGSDVNAADYETCLSYLKATGYPVSQIHLVKGWFQNSLPVERGKIGPIAILRMDGDFYESTKTVLENLYDLVSPRGIVIIDDYGGFEGCRKAVDEFLATRGAMPHLRYVDHSIRSFMKLSS